MLNALPPSVCVSPNGLMTSNGYGVRLPPTAEPTRADASRVGSARLRGRDSNPNFLIQSQASYH